MAETTDEQLNKPGDVKVDELFITLSNGENYDLLPFFVELNLYEDVWNVFCTGNWKKVEPTDKALNKYCDWLWRNYA